MTRFHECDTPMEGLVILERQKMRDSRGYFERVFCQNDLAVYLNERTIQQINHTSTTKEGIVRGMHYQHPPFGELKIVTCMAGTVFDVVLDLRQGSATFLQYYSIVLRGGDEISVLIPEGFAHGFQSLSDDCRLLYLHSNSYQPDSMGVVNALDPLIGIEWPRPIFERSARDSQAPFLDEFFSGVAV